MKIAITADVHLTTRSQHPERYQALENILTQMLDEKIQTLIIAGDLFDASSRNYSEFDSFCRKPDYSGIRFLIIPGNHDASLNNQSLTAQNVEVIDEPSVRTLNSSSSRFLFLPFRSDKTMGEYIAANSRELPANNWVLVGHGDWSHGIPEPDPLEPGVYMPITRTDIENYKPNLVFLGHVHKPSRKSRVYYAGSPTSLAINETGRRRFLVHSSQNGKVESRTVETKFIYFNESLVILPVKDELKYLKQKLSAMIEAWNLQAHEIPKARIQLRVRGYTSDKRALSRAILDNLHGFAFYQDQQPDLSQVATAEDVNRAEIAHLVSDWLTGLDWDTNPEQPEKEEILLEALHVIYGD